MERREFLKSGALLGGVSLLHNPVKSNSADFDVVAVNSTVMDTQIIHPSFSSPLKVMQISDLHFSQDSEADLPYQAYSSRMNQAYQTVKHYKTGENTTTRKLLDELVAIARKESPDLIALTGDIFNYPSQTAVDIVKKAMDSLDIPYLYCAGNHDWHYEGMEGSAAYLRDEWINKSLKPLYQGRDPYCSSILVNGFNVVIMDNSTYQITKRQLDFFKREKRKSAPMLLFVHIPLYMPSLGIASCGHPDWGAAVDHGFEIERREPWSASGNNTETIQFINEVMRTEQLIGIFAGHWHEHRNICYKGIHQHIAFPGFRGQYRMIRVGAN